MTSLNGGVEKDASARRSDFVPEVDVLNGGSGESFVEASDAGEYLGPHSAQPSPERARVSSRPLVNERVRQILSLRHESRIGGLLIVGAEYRGQFQVQQESRGQLLQCPRPRDHIAVDEHDQVAGSTSRAMIPRDRRTTGTFDSRHRRGMDSSEGGRIFHGAVCDNDKITERGTSGQGSDGYSQARQALVELREIAVKWHDH
jgi:hypothetical protein